MEWKVETEVLKRVIALLFALAELADRASVVSRPVRLHVLGILRPAEAVAWASLNGTARDFGAPLPPQAYVAIGALTVSSDGDDAADATRLALRFRALALALASLLARAGLFAIRQDPPADRPSLLPTAHAIVNVLHGFGLRAPRQPCPDTS